jgi:hypothetical protein
MTALLFTGYLILMVTVVILIFARYLSERSTLVIVVTLAVWIVYVGFLSYSGFVANALHRPPGAAYILFPVALFIVFLARSKTSARMAMTIPVWALLATQVFRIGVELLLHRLYVDGLAPRMMTYEGGNVDIFVGISAPLIALASTTGTLGKRLALLWNVAGLISLANIALRAIGTSQGALDFLHSEIPDIALGTFPFTFIAGFFAPLAAVLHVLSIRSLRTSLKLARDPEVDGRRAERLS